MKKIKKGDRVVCTCPGSPAADEFKTRYGCDPIPAPEIKFDTTTRLPKEMCSFDAFENHLRETLAKSYGADWSELTNPIPYRDELEQQHEAESYAEENKFGVMVKQAPYRRQGPRLAVVKLDEWPTARDVEECCGVWDQGVQLRAPWKITRADLDNFGSRSHFNSVYRHNLKLEPLGEPPKQPETAAQRERREAREKWPEVD